METSTRLNAVASRLCQLIGVLCLIVETAGVAPFVTAGTASDLVDAGHLGDRGVIFESPVGWGGLQYVEGLGDVDGDGFDDIALSVIFNEDPFDNAVVVILGRAGATGRHLLESGFPGAVFLRAGDPAAGSPLLETVRSAGDLNEDGLADFVVGVSGYRWGAGRADGAAFVVYGQAGFHGEHSLEEIGGGLPGAVFISTDPSDGSVGRIAANLGDFNGDGKPDLALSATTSTNPRGEVNAGVVLVLYETRSLPPVVDLAEVGRSIPGLRIYGVTRETGVIGLETIGLLGHGMEAAGDFNGDGLQDMLVTASELEPKVVYLIQGRLSLPPVMDLADAATLENVTVFRGPGVEDGRAFGYSTQIAGVGDVNGDGRADILLGLARDCCPLPFAQPKNSVAHLVLGSPDLPHVVDFNDPPPDLSVIFHPLGQYDGFGGVVASAGDLNLDGVPDLLISSKAPVNGRQDAGEVYAVFGKRAFGPDVLLEEGFDGIRLQGEDYYNGFGAMAASAGDFNHDGAPDILVMAPQLANSYPGPARAYVIYGIGSREPPLSLESVKPFSGPLRGGTTVVLTGSGFGGRPTVLFGDRPSPNVTTLSATEIDAVTPPAPDAGLVDVKVVIDGAMSRLPDAFEYAPNLPEIDLANLGEKGFVLEGNAFGRWFTWPATSGITFGDISGDGMDDLVVESSNGGGWTLTVVRGGPGLPSTLYAFTPSERVTLITSSEHRSVDGGTVAMLGDVNGDGIADLGIGSTDGVGYILFGGARILGGDLDIEAEAAAGNAVRLEHASMLQSDFTMTLAPVGDLTGDGVGDLAIGFAGAPVEAGEVQKPGPHAGEILFLAGSASWPSVVDLETTDLRFSRIHGAHVGQRLAERLRNVGDVNRDGFDDLLADTVAMDGIGRAFLLFGGKPLPRRLDVESQVLEGGGMAIDLVDGFDHFDWFNVARAGDVNADGYDDLLLGVEGGGGDLQGVTYLVFGGAHLPRSIVLSESPATDDGVVRIVGEGSLEQAGRPGPAGDFNRDGFADFVIGAPGLQEFLKEPGNVFLVFGAESFPPRVDLRRLGGRGMRIDGANIHGGAGFYAGPSGDLNGDGVADFAFSENGLINGDTGHVYVIYSPYGGTSFIRGDANFDDKVDLSDAVYILSYLFLGGPAPPCEDAADTDDRGTVALTDAIFLLSHLFLGTDGPPAPFPTKGADPTEDRLRCLGL